MNYNPRLRIGRLPCGRCCPLPTQASAQLDTAPASTCVVAKKTRPCSPRPPQSPYLCKIVIQRERAGLFVGFVIFLTPRPWDLCFQRCEPPGNRIFCQLSHRMPAQFFHDPAAVGFNRLSTNAKRDGDLFCAL